MKSDAIACGTLILHIVRTYFFSHRCALHHKMMPFLWLYILMSSSICLSLTFTPQGGTLMANNVSSDSDSDTFPRQVVPLPPKPLAWWIGGPHSSGTLRAPGGNGPPVQCDVSKYGRPVIDSCAEAWRDIPGSGGLQSFGSRTAKGQWDVVLPFRFISR